MKNIVLKSREVQDIREFLNQNIKQYNKTYGENIPLLKEGMVGINGRLSRSLGRFVFEIERTSKCGINQYKVNPLRIEFSRRYLLNGNDDSFLNTTLHELAHYISNVKHQDNCEHDIRWQEVCRRLEMEEVSRIASISSLENPKRYMIICVNDGVVGSRNRLTKELRLGIQLGWYSCNKCKSSELYLYDMKEKEFIGREIDLEKLGLEQLKTMSI